MMKTVTFFISIALRENNGENRHIFHFDYVTLLTKYLAKQKYFRRKNQGVWFLLHLLLKNGMPTFIDTILKNAELEESQSIEFNNGLTLVCFILCFQNPKQYFYNDLRVFSN